MEEGCGKTRVVVLSGGPCGEHDVSLQSGHCANDSLDSDSFEPVFMTLTRQGCWQIGTEAPASLPLAPCDEASRATDQIEEGIRIIKSLRPDVVFLALHGRGGEDGIVQGLLDLLRIPYTGSGVRASSLAFDKRLSKLVFQSSGIPTPPHVEVRRNELSDPEECVSRVLSKIGLPCVIKVSDSGSSIGVYPISSEEELIPRLTEALARRPIALIEPHLDGVELTVGVLGNTGAEGDAAPRALPVTEIVPRASAFFDYKSKYTRGEADEITPARISPEEATVIQGLAVKAHTVLGCDGATRTDLILTKNGPQILELNTIPGLTTNSLLPQGARAAGMSFASLIERMIELALERAEAYTQLAPR